MTRIGLAQTLSRPGAAEANRKASVDQIWRAADVCRAKSLVGPVLDALTA